MRIIVVDDMGTMRLTVKKALASLGFKDFVEAKNGKSAFELLESNIGSGQEPISLGIIDWNMEPTSGLDLLKKIREDQRMSGFIFIMLTAEQLKENIVAAVQAGVNEYIVKPFTPNTLREKLESVVKAELSSIKRKLNRYFEADYDPDDPSAVAVKRKTFARMIARAGEVAPWSYMSSLFMGRMFLRFEQFADAEKYFRKTIQIDFGIADAHTLLSECLYRQGKNDEGLKELGIAVVERPGDGALRGRLGEAHLKRGDFVKAAKILREALGLVRSQIDLNVQSGAPREKMAESLRKPKALLLAYSYSLMATYNKMGEREKAAALHDEIAAMEPQTPEEWITTGKTFLALAEPPKGAFAFGKAHTLAPDDTKTMQTLCSLLYNGGHYRAALAFLGEVKAGNPKDTYAFTMSGLIHRRLGQHDEAATEYATAARLDPNDGDIQFNLGVSYYKTDRAKESKPHFVSAKKLKPGIPEIDDYLAKLA